MIVTSAGTVRTVIVVVMTVVIMTAAGTVRAMIVAVMLFVIMVLMMMIEIGRAHV